MVWGGLSFLLSLSIVFGAPAVNWLKTGQGVSPFPTIGEHFGIGVGAWEWVGAARLAESALDLSVPWLGVFGGALLMWIAAQLDD